MNDTRNVLPDYNRKWIVYASKKLSDDEMQLAIEKFNSANPDYDTLGNKVISFDIDELKPL